MRSVNEEPSRPAKGESTPDLGFHEITEATLMVDSEAPLSDVELLSSALQDAREAHRTGLIAGPDVDEVALRRAVRRAWRADVARALRVVGRGGAA